MQHTNIAPPAHRAVALPSWGNVWLCALTFAFICGAMAGAGAMWLAHGTAMSSLQQEATNASP